MDNSDFYSAAVNEDNIAIYAPEDPTFCDLQAAINQNTCQGLDVMDFDFLSASYPDGPEGAMTGLATKTSSNSFSCDFSILSSLEPAEDASMLSLPTSISMDPFAEGPAGMPSADREPMPHINHVPRPENCGTSTPQQILTLTEYEKLKDVFQSYTKEKLQFPSQSMATGFLSAFFVHLDPHCPIVHQPTFSPSTAKRMLPYPVLLSFQAPVNLTLTAILSFAMMACGAIFRRQRAASLRLHEAATEIALEVKFPGIGHVKHNR